MATLEAFWCSAAECVQAQHFRSKRRTATSGGIADHKKWVLQTAGAAWEWMQTPDGGLPMTFAGLVKLFQLKQKATPDLGDFFDVIMLDEAQDINDCMADIVLGQKKARIILVGDRHQVGARKCKVYCVRPRSVFTVTAWRYFSSWRVFRARGQSIFDPSLPPSANALASDNCRFRKMRRRLTAGSGREINSIGRKPRKRFR